MLGQRLGQDTTQGFPRLSRQVTAYRRLVLFLGMVMVWNVAFGGSLLGGPVSDVCAEATPHASASATRRQQPTTTMPPRRAIATAMELVKSYLLRSSVCLYGLVAYDGCGVRLCGT